MKQTVICIAGAHRSGTSMLARLLYSIGLFLGEKSDLMPPAADNPDGFWEHLRFVSLNDEILNAVGAAWDLPPDKNETFDSPALQPIRAKAQLLIEQFADRSLWGWKDPRNSLTLPFWQRHISELKTIIMVRNPLEAAYSMHKRNGTSYALGLRLWEIYNRHLSTAVESDQSLITHYATFFDDPAAELQRIASFMGCEDENCLRDASTLVSLQRRHTTFTLEQMIDAGVAEGIIELYKLMLAKATGGTHSKLPKSYKISSPREFPSGSDSRLRISIPEAESVRQELALRRGAEIQHREEIARHQQTIETLRHELAAKSVTAAAEINRRDGRIEELQKAYAHLDEQLRREQNHRDRLLGEIERAQAEVRRKEEARQSAEQEIADSRNRFLQTNDLLQKVSVRATQLESRNVVLTDRLRKALVELKRLIRFLDQITDAAALLRRSRRWKLANPFRAVLAVLARKPLPGFGHLDKNVERYHFWRTEHPEADRLSDEIQSLRRREVANSILEKKTSSPATTTQSPPPPKTLITFPSREKVEISIIIPVYDQVDFTLACLASIQEHSGDISYEVIVVDDASSDATSELIGRISGLVYLRSENNSGFIASCNQGAAIARGEYLVFLNNDTTVTAGWLAALRDTFESEPEAGLVGSKLIYPDGRLQEAGGIIWRDGSGWNRGKFQDPNDPEYNYLCEVDYCSAASVMVLKALFDSLGGFDTKYSPAYYEDTDLAFKVTESGRKVLYQPLSVVAHYEGITSGTDISEGAKRHQEINRTKFAETWAKILTALPENGDIASYNEPGVGKSRILVIDHHLPMADRDSGSLRMFNVLRILHDLGHHVTFLPDNLADIHPYGDRLRAHGIKILHHPYVTSIRQYLQSHGAAFDVIILSRCDFARKHVRHARAHAPNARLIFDTVDLHFLREQRQAAANGDTELRAKADRTEQLEYELIDQTDETWVVSPAEKALLALHRPDKSIQVVSNIVDVAGCATPFALRRDILFIGSFQHPPNVDAVCFFCRDIFPELRQRLPGIKFYIIGHQPPPDVIALANHDVIVTGFQPDVQPFFNTIRLSVAPLRYGAGVKGKINQSLGFGVPVVATTIAVEGMDLRHGSEIMLADTPDAFVEALISLYLSEPDWNRLSKNGLEKTKLLFSVDAARKQLERLFNGQQRGLKTALANSQYVQTAEIS